MAISLTPISHLYIQTGDGLIEPTMLKNIASRDNTIQFDSWLSKYIVTERELVYRRQIPTVSGALYLSLYRYLPCQGLHAFLHSTSASVELDYTDFVYYDDDNPGDLSVGLDDYKDDIVALTIYAQNAAGLSIATQAKLIHDRENPGLFGTVDRGVYISGWPALQIVRTNYASTWTAHTLANFEADYCDNLKTVDLTGYDGTYVEMIGNDALTTLQLPTGLSKLHVWGGAMTSLDVNAGDITNQQGIAGIVPFVGSEILFKDLPNLTDLNITANSIKFKSIFYASGRQYVELPINFDTLPALSRLGMFPSVAFSANSTQYSYLEKEALYAKDTYPVDPFHPVTHSPFEIRCYSLNSSYFNANYTSIGESSELSTKIYRPDITTVNTIII